MHPNEPRAYLSSTIAMWFAIVDATAQYVEVPPRNLVRYRRNEHRPSVRTHKGRCLSAQVFAKLIDDTTLVYTWLRFSCGYLHPVISKYLHKEQDPDDLKAIHHTVLSRLKKEGTSSIVKQFRKSCDL